MTAKITYNGRKQCISAWARTVGIKQRTLHKRLENGWTIEDALTRPVRQAPKATPQAKAPQLDAFALYLEHHMRMRRELTRSIRGFARSIERRMNEIARDAERLREPPTHLHELGRRLDRGVRLDLPTDDGDRRGTDSRESV
jgi:hypothetical protein